jgi:hypothetical protein
MAYRMSTKLKNEMFNTIRAQLSLGAIYIYNGTQPANADAAPTGTLLGIVTVGAGAWTAVSANTNGLTFAAAANSSLDKASAETWQFKGLASGTAGWFRFVTGVTLADNLALDTTFVHPRIDGRIATSGAEMNLSSVTVVVDAMTTIDTFRITWPAGL